MLDEPVYLEPHKPAWKQAFQSERSRLGHGLELSADMIEHIGSTAVPGLLAKPIVDIMVGVRDFPPGSAWLEGLSVLGYEALGEAGVPGRLYFRQRGQGVYNVHVVEHGGMHWLNNLALRDYLRGSSTVAREYESAKRAAIASGATTLLAYSDAKAPLVEDLLRRALEHKNTQTMTPLDTALEPSRPTDCAINHRDARLQPFGRQTPFASTDIL